MLAERLTAQLLAGKPARDPLAVVEHLLAVQGQDPRGARLAIRARSVGVRAADVDRALSEQRSLLITWLNRGTLHLVRSEDYPWLHAVTAPGLLTGNARRLAQEGVTPAAAERGVRAIERALTQEGPLTRARLGEHVAAAGVRIEGQALPHLLMLASLRGLIVRGPMVGAQQHAYALVRDWLGEPEGVDRERALAELARRYLAGHAPADERDLAKWSGLPLRDVRAGLRAIAPSLVERPDGLLDLAGRGHRHERRHRHERGREHERGGEDAASLPPPRLLGAFDPVLLGWRSRDEILGPHRSIVTVNGLFRPFALVSGRAVGTWGMVGGEVRLDPFGRLARADAAALAADALDVKRFLAPA